MSEEIELKDCPFCSGKGVHTLGASGPGGNTEYFGCGACEVDFPTAEEWNTRPVSEEKIFPMLDGPDIPWSLAEEIYEKYHVLYHEQTLERLAERGGFGWEEVKHLWKECLRKKI